MAIIGDALGNALGLVGIAPLQIVDDEEIEEAVVVDVNPDGSFGPEWAVFGIDPLVEAGFLGDVGEGAVAVVVIERVAVDAEDEEIGMAVVIVVAYRGADVEAGSCEAGLRCNVGESAVAVVAEEAIEVFRRSLLQGCDVCAVGEEDVGTAVSVVIENGNAAGHGFGCISCGGLITV